MFAPRLNDLYCFATQGEDRCRKAFQTLVIIRLMKVIMKMILMKSLKLTIEMLRIAAFYLRK